MTASQLSRVTDGLHRLRRLARDPQTKALYEARESLAAAYTMRAHLQATNGMLFGRFVPAKQRFMSEVHFSAEAR